MLITIIKISHHYPTLIYSDLYVLHGKGNMLDFGKGLVSTIYRILYWLKFSIHKALVAIRNLILAAATLGDLTKLFPITVKPVLSGHHIKWTPSIMWTVAEVPKFIFLIYFFYKWNHADT